MIRFLVWSMIFAAILAGGGRYVWHRVRRVSGQAGALGRQLAEAEALTSVVSTAATELQQQRRDAGLHPDTAPPPQLAVFASPARLARERTQLRRALAEQRRQRRVARRPGWARHVH